MLICQLPSLHQSVSAAVIVSLFSDKKKATIKVSHFQRSVAIQICLVLVFNGARIATTSQVRKITILWLVIKS
jgi:hypothetical protein